MSSELASVQYLFGIEILLSEFFVHETAVVDSGAMIGKGCRIWHWTHICAGARIGDNVSLGQNVFVGDKLILVITAKYKIMSVFMIRYGLMMVCFVGPV